VFQYSVTDAKMLHLNVTLLFGLHSVLALVDDVVIEVVVVVVVVAKASEL